jgi:hypothetical protein
MDLEHVRQRLDAERRTLVRAGEVLEILPLLTRNRGIDGSWHAVTWSSLSNSNGDEIIAEQVQYYRAQRAEVEWKAYAHDPPRDLLERLARHGFEIGVREAVLVLDLRDPPAWVNAESSTTVVRVEGLDQVEVYRRLAEEVFQESCQRQASELAQAIRGGSREHAGYIALDDGVPACIGRLYSHRDSVFGGLYGGGTLSGHRGRGLYRALVAARARDAIAAGAHYLQVDALPTSRPILERLGFLHLTDTWPCVLARKPVPRLE